LQRSYERWRNVLIASPPRLPIREMQLDTEKHAAILGEALKAVGAPKSLWDYTINIDADKKAVKKELQEHMNAEEKMLKTIK